MNKEKFLKDIDEFNPDIVICIKDNLDGTDTAWIGGRNSAKSFAHTSITNFAINWLQHGELPF